MSKPDLIIRPGDWLLTLWWAEWVIPAERGHWFAWLERAAVCGDSVTWRYHEHQRPKGAPEWASRQVLLEMSADKALVFGEARYRASLGVTGFVCSGSGTPWGGGRELLDAVENGLCQLPPWLHVLVIEERVAERRAGG